ncbi:AAA domain-containing protein [Mycoplasma sp. SG1]|uniref:AAA domain-containing protein n=1 Tax=Mycoplasma sp. SG1 TaxID=2810348 RepID=UPI002024C8B5|nr:AAA domain-containing protein [Mycoplasma sp. SG1]URM53228.1 hypothetical protein JRW51_02680 [Mycoplasma sp. SG1]
MRLQDIISRVINRYQNNSIIFSRFSSKSIQRIDLFELIESLVIDETFFQDALKTKKINFDFSPVHCKKVLEGLNTIEDIEEKHPSLFKEYVLWSELKKRKKETTYTKTNFTYWLLNYKWVELHKRLKTMIHYAHFHISETGINVLNFGFIHLIGSVSLFNKIIPIRSPLLFLKVLINKQTIGKYSINLQLLEDLQINFNFILLEFLAFSNEKTLDYNNFEDLEISLNNINNLSRDKQIEVINQTLQELNNIVFRKLLSINITNFKDIENLNFFNINKFLYSDLNKFEFAQNWKGELNEFEIHPNLVLGLYQVDIEGVIHDLKSLSNKEADKFLADLNNINNEKIIIEEDQQFDFKESDLIQISPLDFTQKKAILKGFENSIIIQGPPGTGKSQTIANLLINNLWNNEFTVFSTEKKVASDVVYEKLEQNYKKFVLKVDDIFTNKSAILEQLKNNLDFFVKPQQTTLKSDEIKKMLFDVNKEIDLTFEQINSYRELSDSYEFKKYIDTLKNLNVVFDTALESEILNHPVINEKYLYNFENIDRIFSQIKLASSAVKFVNDFPFKEVFLTYGLDEEFLNFDWSKCSDAWKSFLYYLKTNKLVQHLSSLKGWGVKNKTEFSDQQLKAFVDYLTKISITEKELLNQYSKSKKFNALELLEKINLATNTEIKLKNLISRVFILHYEKHNFDKLRIKDSNWVSKIKVLIDKKIEITNELIPFYLCEERKKLIVKKSQTSAAYRMLFKKCTKTIEERKKYINIRSFFLKYFEIIIDLCPILILNLSVIPYLFPLQKHIINYLIFDEASQIYFENAITSIYRATKFIIVGDEQQLQPTNFFLRTISSLNNFDEDEEDVYLENTSLLDFFIPKLEKVLLRYHYRSFYPELINFSNKHFYNNELVFAPYLNLDTSALPVPAQEDIKPPIYLKQVTGVYENRLNQKVSESGMKTLEEVYKNKDEKDSVGVIVFNKEQANFFNKKVRETTWGNEMFDDQSSLFIKNIEDIQGDERDIIILLVAFAKNADGKLIRNFGPISRANGDKRVNVAVTRARKQLIIIKSLKSQDIFANTDQATMSSGNIVFGQYLEYIEALSATKIDSNHRKKQLFLEYHKNLVQEKLGVTEFEQAVSEELKEAIPSKFEIKVGVWIGEDTRFDILIYNKNTGYFVLVIECDGDKLNSNLSPKERDWYRLNYFFEHDWQFYWVSSIDWWHPLKKDKIINEIKEILKMF